MATKRQKFISEETDGQELEYGVEVSFDAENLFVDNSNLEEFEGDSQQEFNEYVSNNVGSSASPGFSFGRSGNATAGSWLLRTGGVPSNKTGIPVAILNAKIVLLIVSNENVSSFDITVYEHEGDSIGLTPLVTRSVIASRTDFFVLDVSASIGKQLAVQITHGSAKNLGVDLQLKGEVGV